MPRISVHYHDGHVHESCSEGVRQETVQVNKGPTNILFAVVDGNVHELGIVGFLRRSEDQGGIGSRILRLVFADCFGEC